MWDVFVTDPLLRRIRKMADIEKKLIKNTEKRRKIQVESLELTSEYEKLKREAKSLKKTGKLPDEQVACSV
jgi:hypothetical protein